METFLATKFETLFLYMLCKSGLQKKDCVHVREINISTHSQNTLSC